MPPTDTRRRRCLSLSLTHSSFMVSRSWNFFMPPLSTQKVDVDWFSSDVPILYFSGLYTNFFLFFWICFLWFKWTTAKRISVGEKINFNLYVFTAQAIYSKNILQRAARKKTCVTWKLVLTIFVRIFLRLFRTQLESWQEIQYFSLSEHQHSYLWVRKDFVAPFLVIPYLLSHNNHAHWIKRASALALISCASFTRYYARLELFFCSWTL